MMSIFSEAWKDAFDTGVWKCLKCGAEMEEEGTFDGELICPNCGWSTDVEKYGWDDDEYEELFPDEEDFE